MLKWLYTTVLWIIRVVVHKQICLLCRRENAGCAERASPDVFVIYGKPEDIGQVSLTGRKVSSLTYSWCELDELWM